MILAGALRSAGAVLFACSRSSVPSPMAAAHHQALEMAETYAIEVEYWPTPDPTLTSGNREQILAAYCAVRDGLFQRLKRRFPIAGAPTV